MPVYGKGIYEIGKYRAKLDGKHTASYRCWMSMLRRCYDENFLEKWPTYKGCKVSNEWLYYQTFAEWYWSQKGAGNFSWHLDKDIIYRGNKLYSAQTCFLIPPEINTLFEKKASCRGDYPVGVTKIDNGYVARAMVNGLRKYLGYFKTPEEAFYAHKEAKEAYIRQVAEKYRDEVESKVYDCLLKWKINIDD